MNRLLALLCFGLAIPSFAQVAADPARPFAGDQVYRVVVTNAEQLSAVTDLAKDIWSCHIGIGPIDIQIRPEQVKALDVLGVKHSLMIPDVQALLDAEQEQIAAAHRQRDIAWFSTYRTSTEINTHMTDLAAAAPQLATTFTAGLTLQGRSMTGIRFTSPDLPGNPRSGRPSVLFAACQHAREWISPMTAMYIADTMLSTYHTDPHVHALLDQVEVIVIPVINVDGYDYTWANSANRLWRKNRRDNGNGSFGVDLNRNWGYQWGGAGASTSTGSDTYRGTAGFSEPETQVLRDFIIANPRIIAHIDFHSYAQLILSPWGYTSLVPAEDAFIEPVSTAMQIAIHGVSGFQYGAGPSYTTIYPASGVAPDWCYGARHIYSWTIELRDTGQNGFVLPASQIVPTAQENYAAVLTLSDFAVSKPLWFYPAGGPSQSQAALWLSTPTGFPEAVQARQTATVHISVKNGNSLMSGTPVLYSRVAGSGNFTPSATVIESPTSYAGTLPAAGPGRTIEYYFQATTTTGQTIRYPNAPQVLSVPAYDIVTLFNDDMETDRGWTTPAAGDTATSGRWERAAPVNTPAQQGADASPNGTLCWVTGAAAGANINSNDVDGGITTLASPVISAALPSHLSLYDIRLNYWRAFSNDQGNNANIDTLRVSLSNNAGAAWTDVELTNQNAGAWTRKSWSIPSILPPSSNMKLRVVAGDVSPDSCVEAGLDEVSVVALGVIRSADFNGDSDVGTDQDIEAFFACIAGNCCALCGTADFNGDGDIGTDADIEEFFRVLGGG